MRLKFIIGLLTVFVAIEGGYMLINRKISSRFIPINGYDGFVAIDTASGRLCTTMKFPPLHDANAPTDEAALVRALPYCSDIR
jgi:hypothetical protein